MCTSCAFRPFPLVGLTGSRARWQRGGVIICHGAAARGSRRWAMARSPQGSVSVGMGEVRNLQWFVGVSGAARVAQMAWSVVN